MTILDKLHKALQTPDPEDDMYTLFDSGAGPAGIPDGWRADHHSYIACDNRDIIIHGDLGGADRGECQWSITGEAAIILKVKIELREITNSTQLHDYCDEFCNRIDPRGGE